MKNLVQNMLLVLVMFGTLNLTASSTLSDTLGANHIVLKKGNKISVFDENGEIVYRGTVNYNGNLSRLFNFSQLANGTYTVEIDKDFEIEVSAVEVKNDTVNYLNDKTTTVFKPVFRIEDNTLMVSKLALDTNKVKVEIYFEDNAIHSETVNGTESLNRVYKLDRTKKGNYMVLVRFDDRIFTKSFSI